MLQDALPSLIFHSFTLRHREADGKGDREKKPLQTDSEGERELNNERWLNEWRALLFSFCSLMNFYCIPGFGNIVRVPFMPVMHTGLKMIQKDKQHGRYRERRRAVMFNHNEASVLDSGALRWNETT